MGLHFRSYFFASFASFLLSSAPSARVLKSPPRVLASKAPSRTFLPSPVNCWEDDHQCSAENFLGFPQPALRPPFESLVSLAPRSSHPAPSSRKSRCPSSTLQKRLLPFLLPAVLATQHHNACQRRLQPSCSSISRWTDFLGLVLPPPVPAR